MKPTKQIRKIAKKLGIEFNGQWSDKRKTFTLGRMWKFRVAFGAYYLAELGTAVYQEIGLTHNITVTQTLWGDIHYIQFQ